MSRPKGVHRLARDFVIAWDAHSYAEEWRENGEKFRGRTPQEWEEEWLKRLEALRDGLRLKRPKSPWSEP